MGGGAGTGVSNFSFTMNPNLNFLFLFFFGGVDKWTVEKAQLNLPLQLLRRKKIFLFSEGGRGDGMGGGVGDVVDGWAVEQAQTNLPLQLFRRKKILRSWGLNNALMYKLCP